VKIFQADKGSLYLEEIWNAAKVSPNFATVL